MECLSATERRVVEDIRRNRDALIELASDLIRFDTTARVVDEPARDEEALQRYLAGRLHALGAFVDVWEPSESALIGHSMVPPGLRFDGRPQLAARFRGTGGGRSLLLNGHIDVVSCEHREQWTSDPNHPEVRGGNLYGRGACDMKGGIASMVFAAETLARLGIHLMGDLLLCTVTDEESTGAGGAAAVEHGVRADAAIVTEPSGFDAWIACRGSLIPVITVEGRAGHAGFPQPSWEHGGAVNAIEKMQVVIDAMRSLQAEWRANGRYHHPLLSPGEIVPVLVSGGDWTVTIPAQCTVTYHVAYVPGQGGDTGWGRLVEEEIAACIAGAAQTDSWLRAHPPSITWAAGGLSAEVSADEPIVSTVLGAAAHIGRRGQIAGMDNWHDGTTFIRFGGIPAICFGPGDNQQAHTVDEHVPVDDLVDCAAAIAVSALRFCGEDRSSSHRKEG